MSDITNVEVLTPAEFRERSRTFWLFGTGAGAALFAGALLGVIVGTVVVAQTLYASTKEHLNEFATLRAIGSSRRYIYKVIIWQALLSAVIGFSPRRAGRRRRRAADRGDGVADRHHARADGRAVPADPRHVHRVFDRGDRSGHPHRTRHGVHAMTEPLLEAVNLTKDLGSGAGKVAALKGVSLALNGGELTLLMGPSGSGKTTLLSILGCMLTPTEGTVRVCQHSTAGLDPEELARLRRDHVGFVFQSFHLFPTLSTTDNVRLALDVRGERPQGGKGPVARGTGEGRPGPQDKGVSARTQRRRTAAGGDRARHRRKPVHHPGRRAHRRA